MRTKLFLLVLTAICSFFASSAEAQTYAITNAKIVTVSGATIDKGTIVIRNGLIDAVGVNLQAPADAQVFDATGLTVYPGFIDSFTNVGMPAAAARPGGPGGGGGGQAAAAASAAAQPTSNSNYQAGLRPEDSVIDELRAGESQFDAVRNSGITTVLTTGRTGIFNGQSAVINLAGDSVSAMVVKAPFAQHISFATTPAQYPGSLLGTFAALRQIFLDAQRLQELQKQYAANPKGMKRPGADRSLEALYPAINRQMPVVFNANTEVQIIRALDLIKELNLDGVIAGGLESYKVVDRLKAGKVPVLLSLNLPKRTTASSPEADPDTMETLRYRAEAPKSAAKLAAAGVKFAFQSGGATAIGDFFTNAGKAVEGGLSKDAAIRAMTLGAAELLGVDDRLGSIEAGKIANVVVVKGDVFGRDKFVPTMFVDGKLFEQKEAPRTPGGGRGPGGGGPAGGGAAPAGAGISGRYSITIEIPGQVMTSTLNLNQQGSALTGTMVSQLGTAQINNGRATPDGFSFGASVPYGGANVDITMNGKVSGNQISGTLDSALGSIPFSGTKNPQGGEL
ncbi:MAG TPA: amidohydrolase family protein [Pyrinomonadaceae bacterium]|nr:amidohydrolase family protein [Acidobacteriota bacterium]HQZ97651.1 amidohydrolase family protein [Pyrinomonadaceae bacterium]